MGKTNAMLTIKDYQDIFGIKPKINLPENHVVTNDDILNGTIFQSFRDNNRLSNIISGMTVINQEVCLVYPEVDGIEIETETEFPPCGGRQEVTVSALFSLCAIKTDKTVNYISKGRKDAVNALMSITNDSTANERYRYEKHYLINEAANDTDELIGCTIFATYYINGKKYTASKHVSQTINTVSSWRVAEEPTDFITLTLDENSFGNNGGIAMAKVERYFSRVYYRTDSCGNLAEEKREDNLVEDITEKAFITSSNRLAFNVSRNIITVLKQDVGALKREGIITARYLGYTANASIYQAEGGKISYGYTLSFLKEPDKKIVYRELDTALPTKFTIHLESKEQKFIDGEFVSETLTNELKLSTDQDWVSGFIGEDDEGIYLTINIIDKNDNKEEDREATITITSAKDENLTLSIVVLQPSNDIIGDYYLCNVSGCGEYTTQTIDDTTVSFTLKHVLIYEDKTEVIVSPSQAIIPQVTYKSTDDELFRVKGITREGDSFYLKFFNLTEKSMNGVSLTAKMSFKDAGGKQIMESENANIIIKGNDIVTYGHDLCFDGHNKFHEELWKGEKEARIVNVISKKRKSVNGFIVSDEISPIRATLINEEGIPYFDDSFSVKVVDGTKLLVFPYNVTNPTEKIYTITQSDSNDKIELKLTYDGDNNISDINFKVALHNSYDEDIWTGDNGFMLIDNKTIISLKPCWLSPKMRNKSDLIFDGKISLAKGVHKIETYNIIAVNQKEKIHRDCNIAQEIEVTDNVNSIKITIEV